MTGRLDGSTVVVTGGARGIGEAICRTAVRQGAAVGIFDIDEPAGRRLAEELGSQGAHVTWHTVDVTAEEQIVDGVGSVLDQHGPASVLVNCAGRNVYGDPVGMTRDQWDEVFAVDLRAAWLCAKHVLPPMIERRQGSIINIASLHAQLTQRGMFPYAAAKSGLVGLTRSLALELAEHEIRVNAVSPGYVRTALVDEYLRRSDDPELEDRILRSHPLRRIGSPEEVAEVVCFLASDAASFVTGANWSVDGGLGCRFAEGER